MNISVIGTGYVGLVTGTCFAEMGHNVICVDIDETKVNNLKNGIMPIYEPGLEEMVVKNANENRLHFTTDIKEASEKSTIHFIAVGTPPGADDAADLRFVQEVARQLGQTMTADYNIIVDKSTVPVGTADKVSAIIDEEIKKRNIDIDFDVVSNPEFLKEGTAIDDFMNPDRVVIGADSERGRKIMHSLYAPFTPSHERILMMGVRGAEMTKYASNAMLATKISFMNEIAELCEKLDVDIEDVRHGMGSDSRIGYEFIYPGCGYGGSCFPKDVKALVRMAAENDVPYNVLDAVEIRNQRQKERMFVKINDFYNGDVSGKTFCMWGLAFKPGTDDMREAPSLQIINDLVNAGAIVQAYDPVAKETAAIDIPDEWLDDGRVKILDDQYQSLESSDALILVTEWKQFRNPDFNYIKDKLSAPVIFDGRNQYDPELMASFGITYSGIGRTRSDS
ncbi:MAG: UDP-glucose/GDP-mannose dehydrogenase family protein [Gammaproteobacteria bacterium]|nr:UDP-glucose/GDP-mannose dehydrogenase family protein [Gammaproteobacteria bacterium]NNJ51260.1 UDP-glucose/GDP-mannose dehydrogenase family protein [Gammaproteobacteria bacterium]